MVPELSDKQTLRRRNRAAARTASRTKTVDSIGKEEANSSTSGSSSPTRSNASVSPPSDLPKPLPSYGTLEILQQATKPEANYGQSILNAYLYQQGE